MIAQLERTRTIFLLLAAVLIVGNLIYIDRNFDSVPKLGESARALWYALPTLIGLTLAIASVAMGEYIEKGNLRGAILGALGSLSVVGFIILFRQIFGPK